MCVCVYVWGGGEEGNMIHSHCSVLHVSVYAVFVCVHLCVCVQAQACVCVHAHP